MRRPADVRVVDEGLLAEIAAAGDAIEAGRRLPSALVARLAGAGLFRLLVPREVGGEEADLRTFAEAIEEVAAVDASTAWCLYQCGVSALAVALCVAPEAAAEVFADPAVVVASGAGRGTSVVAPEGAHRISGTWAVASGIHCATWLMANTRPRGDDSGPVIGRMSVVPVGAAEVGDDWHVSGLRGTGSDTYRLDDVLVPAAYGAPYSALETLPGRAPVGRFATVTLYGVGVAAVALGVAGAALDALVELAATKTPGTGAGRLGERPAAQASVGRSATSLAAARAHLHGRIDAAWAEACAGGVSNGVRMELRGAIGHAIEVSAAVVEAVHATAGISALYVGLPFERRVRDMHAVIQHPQSAGVHFEAVGRSRLGDVDAIEGL